MDKFIIRGGKSLKGSVKISGSKNATLPVIAATILAPGKYKLSNVPDLKDVHSMIGLLKHLGAQVEFFNNILEIDTSNVNNYVAPYDIVRKMRASIYVLGSLLGRFKKAKVSLPGGCAWGPRPVDLHIQGIKKLNVNIELDEGYINANTKKLKGNLIDFPKSSVGATGNILMAAVLAEGTTVINNAAKEPEIESLVKFLLKMGAEIEGLGSDTLAVTGVKELHPVEEKMIPDRIEAATYLVAGAITCGEVEIRDCIPGHFESVLEKLKIAGNELTINKDKVKISNPGGSLKSVDVITGVYPGFPTDMQAQWIALMAYADGISYIEDRIFLDRFTHVAELVRLGADIKMENNIAIVTGVNKLKGAPVMSTDLRASASLVLAGLIAEGKTEILRIYHIDRGYERIGEKLQALGAEIVRVPT
ncbi:UDP-N-acetylglucosamine 1-carboxyvinyltransferase [candidate division KSB1 bacterium]